MTNAIYPVDIRVPVGSLEAYVQKVSQIPLLSLQEEQALALRYQNNADIEAAKQLVLSHLRFVVKIAKGYMGYGLALGDLIQEGNLGLMKAVKRFDPNVGVRLVSFAVHWIKAEIHEFILRNWRIVKVATTKAKRKLFFHLRSAKKRLGWFTQAEVESVAKDLGVPPQTVIEMEEYMNHAHDMALENRDDEESDNLMPIHYLEDHRYAPEKQLELQENNDRYQLVHHALSRLDDRSRIILEKRWLAPKKATLQELATDYQVSAERIRQLEENAIKKLKKELRIT